MSQRAPASAVSPEFVLLGLLRQQSAHGYDLHERLSTELGWIWRIGLSQTYNILNRLESRGYIAGAYLQQEKAPARRRYVITPSGRTHFENWLAQPTRASAHAIRVEFLTRLYFAEALFPERVPALIDAQIAHTRETLNRLTSILQGIPEDQRFNRLGLECRAHQLSGMLDWLSGCAARLEQLTLDAPDERA